MVTRHSASGRKPHSFATSAARKNWSVTPLCAAVCACLGLGSLAEAQDTPEEIVITGSRIVRRDLEAPSPIITVGVADFEQSSNVSVETVLNQYPQFNPGTTQFNSSQNQPTADTSPGAATLNMRGLGASRSLVLINGRRAQPINAALAVDVNTIPAAMIESVEVISGGAAATYGPDALAGVVNFRLKTDFEGLQLNYQTGVTAQGDGEESRADVLLGGNLEGGRGNAVFSLSWAERQEALTANRDFFVDGWLDPGTNAQYPRVSHAQYQPEASNLPSLQAVQAQFPGAPNGYRSSIFFINNDGSLFKNPATGGAVGYTGSLEFPYKQRTQTGQIEEVFARGYVSSPMTRYSAFGHGRYDIADKISVFAQGSYVTFDVEQLQLPFFVPNIAIPRSTSRPFESPQLAALLDSRQNPNADWLTSRVAYYNGNRGTSNHTKLLEFLTGVQGEIGTEWTYEGYTSYGETTLLTDMKNQVWIDRFAALARQPGFGRNYLLQPFNPTAASFFCTTGLPLLEPWNLDGNGVAQFENPGVSVSQDCLTAITAPMTMRNVVTQRVHEFNAQGKIADLPAGELRSAFGVAHRVNKSSYEPDPLWDRAVPAQGQTTVSELYGEVLVPIVGRFELELGARYSDFETGGFAQDAQTYKVLFSWGATEALRFRGGFQRANRTPNVAELYSGDNRVVTTWLELEPCNSQTQNPWGNVASNPDRAQVQALCRAIMYRDNVIPGANDFDPNPDGYIPSDNAAATGVYSNIERGNPQLKPEDADTWTLGAVWQAPERNITVSADYYDIFIEDAVGTLNFQTAYQQCFNFNGSSNPSYDPNNDYCRRIRRDPATGTSAYVEAVYFNLGQVSTKGVDVDVSWRASLADIGLERIPGDFGIRAAVNKLIEFESLEVPGTPLLDYAGSTAEGGLYDWITFTTLSYNNDRLGVNLSWRHLPEVENEVRVANPNANVLPTDSYDIFNLNGTWSFNERMRLRGGIDNLLDKDPPIVGAEPGVNNRMGQTMTNRYDPLGRRYFIGLTMDF